MNELRRVKYFQPGCPHSNTFVTVLTGEPAPLILGRFSIVGSRIGALSTSEEGLDLIVSAYVKGVQEVMASHKLVLQEPEDNRGTSQVTAWIDD